MSKTINKSLNVLMLPIVTNLFLTIVIHVRSLVQTGSLHISVSIVAGHLLLTLLSVFFFYINKDRIGGRIHSNVLLGLKIELLSALSVFIIVGLMANIKFYTDFDTKLFAGVTLLVFFYIFRHLIEIMLAGILMGVMIHYRRNP